MDILGDIKPDRQFVDSIIHEFARTDRHRETALGGKAGEQQLCIQFTRVNLNRNKKRAAHGMGTILCCQFWFLRMVLEECRDRGLVTGYFSAGKEFPIAKLSFLDGPCRRNFCFRYMAEKTQGGGGGLTHAFSTVAQSGICAET